MPKQYGKPGKRVAVMVEEVSPYRLSCSDLFTSTGDYYELARDSRDPEPGEIVVLEKTESAYSEWKVVEE